ncbi:DNA-processing protein DprA [Synechococcus sp. LTW-G]
MGQLVHAPFCASQERGRPLRIHSGETSRLWRSIWSRCPGVGRRRLEQLEGLFGSLHEAWQATGQELEHALSGTQINARVLQRIELYRQQLGPAPLSDPPTPNERRRWGGQRCLMPGDPAFPRTLGEIDQPPLALHWAGQGSIWAPLRQRRAVAVLGTRRPSKHGLAMAQAIGRALAQAGWPVVAGLSEGIQAAAHQSCLQAGGTPVAVLGTPINQSSPRGLAGLQQDISAQGLLLSEWPEGTASRAAHFGLRQRLEVGLVQALVLIECPQQSAALHAAELGWAQGIPLWVVPADAGRSTAAGSNRLLARGATPLLDPADLVKHLGCGPRSKPVRPPMPRAHATLMQREAALMGALGQGATLEQLCHSLRLSPVGISQRLLQLELAGLVRSAPGLWWHPC